MDEKIVNRIKKLLALSDNNSNPEEAKSALLKAQELMAKYGIEITNDEDKPEYDQKCATTPKDKGFKAPLAVIIGENFRCKPIMVGKIVYFIGHKDDVKICIDAFNFAYKVAKKNGDKEYKRCKTEGLETKNVFNSYVMGFLKGLKEALDAQCQALMIIVPEDVNEEFTRRFPATKNYKGGIKNNKATGFNSDSYVKGHKDGKNFGTKKQVTA